MNKIPIREKGLVGTLFRPESSTATILVLGGSSGGLNETRAEQIASHGFSTLALAYFAAETLSPTLSQIPLEYFETAIDHLCQQTQVERIGIWGGSRGAELALILGTLFPDRISAIAALVPSSVVHGSFDDQNHPAWTYRGKALGPHAPFSASFDLTLGENEATPIAATPHFLAGMADKVAFAASAIPVEKIQCPLLLISAQDDQMWPSDLFARQIIDRLTAHRSPIIATHLSYPNVGHAPAKGTAGLHPILKRWFAYGGNADANAFAAKDWHDQAIAFFQHRSKIENDLPQRPQR